MRYLPKMGSFLVALIVGISTASWAAGDTDELRDRDDRIASLESKMEGMIGEIERLRTQVAVPEEKELVSTYGLGPAASKIYGVERGLSIGGYGEGYWTNYVSDESSGSFSNADGDLRSDSDLDRSDFYRWVMYMGYKFSENILFNAEIEFEHATTGATETYGGGSVSVEFAALEFFWKEYLNARVGMLLVPMGFLNEIHEPNTFHGVQRPHSEKYIIPSTWRENGIGIFGNIGGNLEYRSYLITSLNADGFSNSGVRSGRQKGAKALAEDVGWVTRADYQLMPSLSIGGSVYFGATSHNQEVSGTKMPDADLTIWEIHGQWNYAGFETRAMYVQSDLDDAAELNSVLGKSATAAIAEEAQGYYGEVAYDLGKHLFGGRQYFAPFFRFEHVNPQDKMPTGYTATGSKELDILTFGLTYKPHPNVVLKAEYRNFDAESGEEADELSLGMGFAF